MNAQSPGIAVILCCSWDDTPVLQPLSDHLCRKGTPTRLLAGVAEDPHVLGKALDEETGACMFVACLSDTLGPKRFRRLTGIYNARKGPAHYLADILVEPDEIEVMSEAITTALARASKVIATPNRDKRSNSRGPTRLRDVVGVTGIRAVGAERNSDREARSSRRKQQDTPPEKRAPLREQSISGPYVISSAVKAKLATDASAAEDEGEDEGQARSELPAPAPTPDEHAPDEPSPGEPGPAPEPDEPEPETSEPDEPEPDKPEPEPEPSDAPRPDQPTANASASMSMAQGPSASMSGPAPTPSSSSMSVVLFLILIAVAGTAVLVFTQVYGDDSGSSQERGVPTVADPDQASQQDAGQQDAGQQDAIAAGTESGGDTTEETGETEAGSETSGETGSETGGETGESGDIDEAAIIREAIAKGDMRAIDLILVANPDPELTWREASTFCRRKSYQGVRGWRLPTRAELKTLRSARILERERYWSSTLAKAVGDGSDHVFVLDLQARTLDPVSKDAEDVKVLCVRPALP